MEQEYYSPNERIPETEEAIELWVQKINCEKRDLQDAIFKVGTSVRAVVAYLEMNCKIKDD